MENKKDKPLTQRILGPLAVIGLIVLGALAVRNLTAEEYHSGLPVESLSVHTAKGDVTFEVEIAEKQADKEIGLMYRKSMPKNHGMLFEMSAEPKEVAFWMKNTLIPLDMLYVAKDGTIVNIHHMAIPEDTTPLPSRGAVTGVVELNGGLADASGIKIGDKVIHPYFH